MKLNNKSYYIIKNDIPVIDITYLILMGVFISTIIITNVITAKYFTIKNFTFTSGAITYNLTFIITDIVSEVYGEYKARLMVWIGFIGSIFMVIILLIAQYIDTYEYSLINQESFKAVFHITPSIVIGSMAAYLTSQLLDIYIFSALKVITKGRHLWLRNSLSTLVSQLIDTIIFSTITWILWPFITSGSLNISPIIWDITINEYIFKIISILIGAPVVYISVSKIRKGAL